MWDMQCLMKGVLREHAGLLRDVAEEIKVGAPVAALTGPWCYRSVLGLVGPVAVCCD